MAQEFSVHIPKWVERFLRLVPRQVRSLLVSVFILLHLAAAVALFLNFVAGDDPLLQQAATYLKLYLMCFVVFAVTAVIGRCLWVLIRSNPSDEKRGGQ